MEFFRAHSMLLELGMHMRAGYENRLIGWKLRVDLSGFAEHPEHGGGIQTTASARVVEHQARGPEAPCTRLSLRKRMTFLSSRTGAVIIVGVEHGWIAFQQSASQTGGFLAVRVHQVRLP